MKPVSYFDPAKASCDANFIASQREMARVPIVASPKTRFALAFAGSLTGLYVENENELQVE